MQECLLYAEPELYDLLFPNASASETVQDAVRRERLAASERFYLDEAARGGPVLELACGTGRLTVPIAQAGVEIVGADLSETMLEAARAKAAQAGAKATFVHADMSDFDLPRQFAAIFNAGNSLQHLLSAADLRRCLTCARKHLAAGGRLVFDVSNPDREQLAKTKAGGPRSLVHQVNHPKRGEIKVEEAASYDVASGIRDVTWYFSAPGAPDFRAVDYRLRMIFPQEIEQALAAAGLRVEKRYGEYSRIPFEPGSPRQVYICVADP